MITQEEKQQIVNEVKEQLLLAIPEIVGNLIQNQMYILKTNKKFFEQFPDFSGDREIVAQAVDCIEKQFPTLDYAELLQRAVPLIREQIKTSRSLDIQTISSKPERNLSLLNTPENGAL